MFTSVIISVYKNVEALQTVLRSLEHQTVQSFEVIISEDGQCAEMADFVRSHKWAWPHQHLTQEDLGWRKNRALNRAVLAAKHDWLIFIDGDCVLHPRFIEWHLREAERYHGQKVMIGGKRIKLSSTLSQRLIQGCSLHFLPRLFAHSGCRYVEEAFYIPICQWLRRPIRHLVGSNMAMSRQALLEINGFDENYTRPATGEDYDIEWRLCALGYRIVSLRNLAIQYHLWHRENWTEQSENMVYCQQMQEQGQIICQKGIQLHV